MTIQGTASASAASVAMPAHQAGDLIIVVTYRNSTGITTPAAGGTVPVWIIAQTGQTDFTTLRTAWAKATASDHTTGVWTNAAGICVLVLRPNAGQVLIVGPSSSANAATTQTIVYPALTLSTIAGTSWGVRAGCRGPGGGDSEVANPPSGWTNQMFRPSFMAVHTLAALISNLTADTVPTTGVDAAYRAHTIEVTERIQAMATIA